MADLGAIGMGPLVYANPDAVPLGRIELRCMRSGLDYMMLGQHDTLVGNATPPSVRLDALGRWRFRWVVAVGERTISIWVKQAVNLATRPSLTVKANPLIGVNADVSASAASGAGFVLIGPVTINPTQAGAVWVELWNNLSAQYAACPCYFDDIAVT